MATDTAPAANNEGDDDDGDEPAAVPAAATNSVLSVNSKSTPEEWSYVDDGHDKSA